jgi:hypothetical protein
MPYVNCGSQARRRSSLTYNMRTNGSASPADDLAAPLIEDCQKVLSCFAPLVSGPPGTIVNHWLVAFKYRSTESIVFQLRVVAGAPNSLSIWPR